jgi:hypothetical protein
LNKKDCDGRVVGNSKYGVYAFYDYDGEPIYAEVEACPRPRGYMGGGTVGGGDPDDADREPECEECRALARIAGVCLEGKPIKSAWAIGRFCGPRRSVAGQGRAEDRILGRERVHHGQMPTGSPNARLARAAGLRRGCQRGLQLAVGGITGIAGQGSAASHKAGLPERANVSRFLAHDSRIILTRSKVNASRIYHLRSQRNQFCGRWHECA